MGEHLRTKAAVFCVLLSLLTLGYVAWGQGEKFVVAGIEIQGNRHVPTAKILKAVGFRAGDTIDVAQVREALEAIGSLGYFSKVDYELEETEGGKYVIRFTVTEYPLVKEIEIRGLPKSPSFEGGLIPYLIRLFSQPPTVSKSKILDILKDHGIEKGKVLNADGLKKALEEVLEEFRKKDIATATVGQVIPGEKLIIQFRILPVVGNEFVGLKTVPQEVATSLVSVPLGKVGRISQISQSYQRLSTSVYFSAVNVEPEPTDDGVILRWELTERVLLPEPTVLKGIQLTGIHAFPRELVIKKVNPLPEGEVDNYRVLKALEGVYSYYVREGYFMVDLVSEGVVDGILRVRVLEGALAGIRIKGKIRTKELVIRRALGIREGEVLTRARFLAAQQALRGLGYFSKVELQPVREDHKLYLDVSLTERKKLGHIGGSLSYSPKEGIVGRLEYTQRNIWGTAQDLSLSLSRGVGSAATTWSLKWTAHALPLFDRGSLELYRRFAKELNTLGGRLSLSYPLAEFWNLDLGFTSELRWKEEPLSPRNVLEVGITHDTRDDPFFFPRRGGALKFSLEKAGDFAPGVRYLSLKAELTGYHPVDLAVAGNSARCALAQHFLLGWGFSTPVEYEFELGGPNSVRGAASHTTTPRIALLNTEFRLELAQGAHIAFFWDLGASLAGDGTVKSSVGLEIAARIMGAFFRLDLAWPNDREWKWVPQFEFGWSPLF